MTLFFNSSFLFYNVSIFYDICGKQQKILPLIAACLLKSTFTIADKIISPYDLLSSARVYKCGVSEMSI